MSEQTGALIATEQDPDNELLTVPQVAKLLKKHQNTIRSWIYQGHLPAQKVGKWGRFQIKRSDLETALTYTPTSESEGGKK